ncbi:2-amino-4-hydroxy-6-hydroxymethyldihydropteridine diphosphokinase [Acinetobacter sp. B10A]|uniref:2-amino-4-hydroxy-6- hydroxymethyldihydropteridine diphosphokinase n=1 Tax=Acinetobacter baretiae TaxID=2605383 RepID=UPI001B3C6659|nr:2-amino-4-hydroxy-6-hydroxymethyldihydropteridine diphosphokinase [Acinetobacter baretiae]MBF7685193.1 2-amino-4-hydroxy-6-hydroxymethyldihydropteridine diphosphokinase [Acinetobacter baretiae]
MIFALALASNLNADRHLNWALQQLKQHGQLLAISSAYEMQCRDGVGADYLNSACVFESCHLDQKTVSILIKSLEEKTGRVRPSHQISLDIDLIAWKDTHAQPWQFNLQKMPFALDVKVPLSEILPIKEFYVNHQYDYKKRRYEETYE